jgi:hypothetical protein
MKAQPHRRTRRTYKNLFLDELQKLSGGEQKFINNNTLQKSLKWDDNVDRAQRNSIPAADEAEDHAKQWESREYRFKCPIKFNLV